MKRLKKIFYAFFLLIWLLCLTMQSDYVITAKAEGENGKDELNTTILEQIDKLDLAQLQAYIDSLGINDGKSVADRLLEYISGGDMHYQDLLQDVLDIVFEHCAKLLPAFACIAAISILCGIVNHLRSGMNAHASGQAISLIAYLSALIPLVSILIECVEMARGSVEQIQTQVQLIFPLLITLMAASGQTATAAICQPTVAFLSSTVLSVIDRVIFPLTLTILAFSMVGNLSSDIKLGKFAAFFKSINKWLIGITVSVFGLFFSVQGIVAASYDGITRRVAKYAIGTGVPIIGGFLSGGFDLAVAGSILIKNSLGALGIFLIISVLFEPLTLLITVNVLLRLTSAITQPFGDSKISDFLSQTADDLNYCTAGLLLSAFMYVVCIVIVICASETVL